METVATDRKVKTFRQNYDDMFQLLIYYMLFRNQQVINV